MFQISICFDFSPTPTKFYQLHNKPIPLFQPTLHIWGKPNNSPTTPNFFCILFYIQCFILDRRYVMGKYFVLAWMIQHFPLHAINRSAPYAYFRDSAGVGSSYASGLFMQICNNFASRAKASWNVRSTHKFS